MPHRPYVWGIRRVSLPDVVLPPFSQGFPPSSQHFPSIFHPFGTAPGGPGCRGSEALDIAVLSATVAAAGLGALLAEAAVITALLVTGLTVYTFRR